MKCRLLLMPLFCCTSASGASAPPPIIRATQSANGHCLVLISYKLAPTDPQGGGSPINSTTFQLFAPAALGSSQRFPNAGKLWADSAWTLTVPRGGDLWPLVSDDCSTLLLLHAQPPSPNETAFTIYRRDHDSGTPIGAISLNALWTPRELDPSGKGLVMIYDSTPFWFAGGFLEFSPDCNTLLYRTQWNDRLRIDLTTGNVTRLR